MTRRTRNLLLLGVVLAAFAAGVAPVLVYFPRAYYVLFPLGLLLLIPARVSAYHLNDLYRSRRFFDAGAYEDAIAAGERMLATLADHPWLRHFAYLTWMPYSWNVVAMSHNNVGAAQMMLGRFVEARQSLRKALAEDPGYALPYANLAAIAAAEGDRAESEAMARLARDKGYAGDRLDALIRQVAGVYAGIQGRG